MGYNLTRYSVHRNRTQLDQLLKAKEKGQTLFYRSNHPGRLASKIREAIKAAGEFTEYEHYHAELSEDYRFEVRKDGVLAVFIGVPPGIPVGADVIPEIVQADRTSDEPPRPEKEEFPEVTSLMEVMSAAMESEAKELHFPDAVMLEEDKHRLYLWGKKNKWKLIDHEDKGITLTTNEVPPSILWKPTEPEDA